MATYKLIQDIEAEDHILGPLTLRQFIFALIATFLLYICFFCVTKGAPFLLVLFLPPAVFCLFFAFPFGRDQPTELWALAKLRYWFKPRRRIWNQDGIKELVTITVPKKVEHVLTNGLSQGEVKSRLNALASTIDSRGWAIKNVDTFGPMVNNGNSDRLIDIDRLAQVPQDDVETTSNSDDIMDNTGSNPIARQFDTMIDQSTKTHRQKLIDELNDVRETVAAAPAGGAPADYWFINKSPSSGGGGRLAQAPAGPAAALPAIPKAATPDEAALSSQLKAQASARPTAYGNLHTLQPLSGQPAPTQAVPQPAANTSQAGRPAADSAVTAPSDPAILSLANNNDLNVATLAREAQKAKDGEGGEVVISLR